MRVVLVGAGGHARVLLDAMRLQSEHEIVAAVDANRGLHGLTFEGIPIVGGEDVLPELHADRVEGALLGVGSVDVNDVRRRLHERISRLGFEFPVVVHPSAVVAEGVHMGPATMVFANAVINPGARLGTNVIVNTGALVDHDVVVGDFVHISPGAHIAGGVRVGAGSHVGIGSTVLQGIAIGERALVAAGAVVTRAVADGARVAGVPARPMR